MDFLGKGKLPNLTHWPLGDMVVIWKCNLSNSCYGLSSWVLLIIGGGGGGLYHVYIYTNICISIETINIYIHKNCTSLYWTYRFIENRFLKKWLIHITKLHIIHFNYKLGFHIFEKCQFQLSERNLIFFLDNIRSRCSFSLVKAQVSWHIYFTVDRPGPPLLSVGQASGQLYIIDNFLEISY